MIRTALEFVKRELENYMVERDPDVYRRGSVVDLKPLVNINGEIAVDNEKHITLMQVGVEEERREGKRPYLLPTDDKQFLRLNPPIDLTLYLLFAAHRTDYNTALRELSNVVSFFQSNAVFDEQKYPSLNSEANAVEKPWEVIERLGFRLYNLSFEQQNNLWSMLGAKYLPSVVYKMQLLTVFETRGKEKVPPVAELNFTES